jgi:hypothetical protein
MYTRSSKNKCYFAKILATFAATALIFVYFGTKCEEYSHRRIFRAMANAKKAKSLDFEHKV